MRLQCFCLSSNIIHCVVLQTPFFLPDRESSSWNAKEEKNGKIKGEDSHCSGPNTKVKTGFFNPVWHFETPISDLSTYVLTFQT